MEEVSVKSSLQLDEQMKNKIINFIIQKTSNKGIKVNFIIDESIIGGIIIKIDDIVYDGSIKRQVLKLKENL